MSGRAAALLLLALAACAPRPAPQEDSNGLYRQMQACVAEVADPAPPCTLVAPARGFVVIKDHDPAKPFAWLLVPTAPVTGIEDPAIFRPPVAGFWPVAWQVGRRFVPAAPQSLGLAINSAAGRSQNQLHIHISCVAPEIVAALAAAEIGPDWTPEPALTLAGQRFSARRVAALEPSPFELLRARPGAAGAMGRQSLAVIGAPGGGYFLLSSSDAPGVPASTEALLDERCSEPPR